MASQEPSGRDLADDLVSADAARVASARAVLDSASKRVEAAAVKRLAAMLGDTLRAGAVCRAITDGALPRLGPNTWSRLFRALATASAEEYVRQPAVAWMMAHTAGADPQTKVEAATPPRSAGPVPRVLSVFTQIWVWVALGFGNCTNHYECEAACPKDISRDVMAQMNRDYAKASLLYRDGDGKSDGAG